MDVTKLVDAFTSILVTSHRHERLQNMDRECFMEWVAIQLAAMGVYTTPVGSCYIYLTSKEKHEEYYKDYYNTGLLADQRPPKAIPKEVYEEGDMVVFHTSGKYNPGYSTTETYVGELLYLSDDAVHWKIKVEGKRPAFVRQEHIEGVVETNK